MFNVILVPYYPVFNKASSRTFWTIQNVNINLMWPWNTRRPTARNELTDTDGHNCKKHAKSDHRSTDARSFCVNLTANRESQRQWRIAMQYVFLKCAGYEFNSHDLLFLVSFTGNTKGMYHVDWHISILV